MRVRDEEEINNDLKNDRSVPKFQLLLLSDLSCSCFSAVRLDQSESGSGSLSENCVALMPHRLTNLRRYCTIFWNAKLCCAHCEGVC